MVVGIEKERISHDLKWMDFVTGETIAESHPEALMRLPSVVCPHSLDVRPLSRQSSSPLKFSRGFRLQISGVCRGVRRTRPQTKNSNPPSRRLSAQHPPVDIVRIDLQTWRDREICLFIEVNERRNPMRRSER
jgi:hypothetical protein